MPTLLNIWIVSSMPPIDEVTIFILPLGLRYFFTSLVNALITCNPSLPPFHTCLSSKSSSFLLVGRYGGLKDIKSNSPSMLLNRLLSINWILTALLHQALWAEHTSAFFEMSEDTTFLAFDEAINP